MRFAVLGSGSKGNCTLVEADGVRLLIDNGFSGKELLRRLAIIGVAPESISAVLLTHEHHDHIKGVGVLARRLNLSVYANSGTYRMAEARLGIIKNRREFATGEVFCINGLQIHPFSVSHDTADPVGFVLGNGNDSLGYCTDTGKITKLLRHHLQRCQALILEANHDILMLKNGPYPLALQQRVLSNQGHLANDEALQLASELGAQKLRLLVLAHLSEVNNRPGLVEQGARDILHIYPELRFFVAEQHQPGPIFTMP